MNVSFIIPFYNAEKYLERCLQSLMAIKSANVEFLFIDDGSKDHGKAIILKYQKTDNRIKVYSQENQGVSVARNLGIQKAKGDWITFIDSDDTIEAKLYDKVMECLRKDIELFLVGYDKVDENKIYSVKNKFSMDIHQYGRHDLQQIQYGIIDRDYKLFRQYRKQNIDFASPWGKFYRRNIIMENQILFPNGIALGEDRIFNYIYYSNVTTCLYCNDIMYHYYQNSNSTMHLFKIGIWKTVMCYIEKFAEVIGEDVIAKKCLWQLGVRQYLMILKSEFCNSNNKGMYFDRKKEALLVREMSIFSISFSNGSVWKLRISAIPVALCAKYKLFFLCNIMLKLKETLHITMSP